MGSDFSLSTGDSQLREDLADAMRESPGGHGRDSGMSMNSFSKSLHFKLFRSLILF